jgi:hypothetical protein
MDRLDVQTSKLQSVTMVLLGVLLVPLSLGAIASGISGGNAVGVGIGAMLLAVFGFVVWLNRRARGKSVRYFTPEGLERNDGRWLAWADLERVVNQVRVDPAQPGEKRLWRTEIWFRNGQSAWLLPLKIGNFGEVHALVRSLPCEHAEKDV